MRCCAVRCYGSCILALVRKSVWAVRAVSGASGEVTAVSSCAWGVRSCKRLGLGAAEGLPAGGCLGTWGMHFLSEAAAYGFTRSGWHAAVLYTSWPLWAGAGAEPACLPRAATPRRPNRARWRGSCWYTLLFVMRFCLHTSLCCVGGWLWAGPCGVVTAWQVRRTQGGEHVLQRLFMA